MSEASAIKDGIAKGRGRLQRQGGGAKLVRCLGASTFCHRAGEARSGEGANLDRPIAARLGGTVRLLWGAPCGGLGKRDAFCRGNRLGWRWPRRGSLSDRGR